MNHRKIAARFFNLALAFAIAIITLPTQAAVPQTLNYQGQLTNAAGVPVNGLSPVNITFSLYTVPTGVTPPAVWSETQPVTVTNGLYSVTLGQTTPLTPALFSVPLYLGITVGADAEMTPRIALSSSATALRASLADTAATLAPTATVAGSQVTGTLSNVTISGATLVDSQLSGTATLCDAAHAGALRWMAATKSLDVCTGNEWMMFTQEPSFRAVDTVGQVGGYTSISIGTDGLPVIAYYDYTNLDLKVAKCGNAACWLGNTLTAVDTAGNVGLYTSISIGTDGLPVIAYYDSFPNGDLKVAKCGNAACSAGNTLTAVDTIGDVGMFTSISIGADGLPVIAYYDNTNVDLKVAKCGNAACSAGNILTAVDMVGNVGAYTSITIGADGLPVIAYYDASNGELKVAHCGNAACSAGNTLTAVDTLWLTGSVGYFTSIAIGADGLPVISYYDVTNGNLKVAHCGNAACTAGNTLTAVDTVGQVGGYTSIRVGADGLPVISYYDYTNGNLKVAHCGNAACSASTLTSVDTVGDVGYYTSIAIGADGLPVISYYDITNGDLKVMRRTAPFP